MHFRIFSIGLLIGTVAACASGDDDDVAADAAVTPSIDAAVLAPDAAASGPDAAASVDGAPGGVDAGATDAGGIDGGGIDAGGIDAGGIDAGGIDAGTPDGGVLGVCTSTGVTSVTNNTVTAIADTATTTSTITVAGADDFAVRIGLLTSITHTFNADLDIVLISPAGTRVSITSDNGGVNNDVFNGTQWTDGAGAEPVTDFAFSDGVTAPVLAPESALSAFFGEDPNGDWTLEITDDAGGDVGTLSEWTLELVGFAAPVTEDATAFTSTPALALADSATTTDTLAVTGATTELCDVEVTTEITHTFNADLDIVLVSPAGTRATLTTDNGETHDNGFNGTRWSDRANEPVTEHVFTDLTVAPLLTAEGALGAFRGEDANGTWTLEITDDAGGDIGVLASWSLHAIRCSCPE